jgi:ribosomal protein S18 acetylase RimI-like enzyme
MSQNSVEIIDFSDEHREAIKILNYEWLEEYFRVEENDFLSLSNPRAAIIDKGGFIFYAKLNGEIVGTSSLLKKDEKTFELGKMAVSKKVQGFKIGTILLEHCLRFAKEKQIETLVLYSNTKLETALHLYRKHGFYEIPLESGLYERADIKMQKLLI